MTKTIYKAEERGFTNHKWLKSYHTFNFANFYDEERTGFGKLLVLNEDLVQPKMGFGTHMHDNMEIISIPLRGKMAHKDDFGNEILINQGEIQVISAGKGLTHTEFNPSETDLLHFLEIWILPDQVDVKPRYQVKHFDLSMDKWVPIIHPHMLEGSLPIYQEACLSLGRFNKKTSRKYHSFHPFHGIFLTVIHGKVEVMEEQLHQFDAIAMEGVPEIEILCHEDSDILVIESPMEKGLT